MKDSRRKNKRAVSGQKDIVLLPLTIREASLARGSRE